MWKLPKSKTNGITSYGFLTLLIVPLVSNPGLIDGISYFKLALALILITPVVPFYLYQILATPNKKAIYFLFIWLIIIPLIYFNREQGYRSVFGSPGRSNGFVSILVFSYYLVFGMYLRKTNQLRALANSIFLISTVVSLLVIIFSLTNIRSDSFLSALNLNRLDFRENIDLFSPLFCFGAITGFYLWKETSKWLYLVVFAPVIFITIWMDLLQIVLILLITYTVWLLRKKYYLDLHPKLLVVGIFSMYLIAVLALDLSKSNILPSLTERLRILEFSLALKTNFSLIPKNIDALSDFSSTFTGSLMLDDFHNVYLQYAFSFGLFLGLLFLIITIYPMIKMSVKKEEPYILLLLYVAIIISLLVGIASPNYILLIAVILGFGLGTSESPKIAKKELTTRLTPMIIVLSVILIAIPAYVQLKDINERVGISKLSRIEQSGMRKSDLELMELLRKALNFPDAGYRFLVATNFYQIGFCFEGDLILNKMRELNSREYRLTPLGIAGKNCREA